MTERPKTILCDIDGTLVRHCGDITKQSNAPMEVLDNTLSHIKRWDASGYKIILITGRRESTRAETERQLHALGIIYDQIVFGATGGDRVLINDKKPNSSRNTAYAFNVVRNVGIPDVVNFDSANVVVNDDLLYKFKEKPWGSEELIACNDKYVMKKLHMKKNECCSLQYHELKRETVYVLSGKLKVYIGTDINALDERIMTTGDSVTIDPFVIHRMEGLEDDTYYLEASTSELWDVVRLHDKYARI